MTTITYGALIILAVAISFGWANDRKKREAAETARDRQTLLAANRLDALTEARGTYTAQAETIRLLDAHNREIAVELTEVRQCLQDTEMLLQAEWARSDFHSDNHACLPSLTGVRAGAVEEPSDGPTPVHDGMVAPVNVVTLRRKGAK